MSFLNLGHEAPMLRALLVDLAKNAVARARNDGNAAGSRWSPEIVGLFAILTIKGGPAVANFFKENIGGPSIATIKRHTSADRYVLKSGFEEDNVKAAVAFYAPFLAAAGISAGSVMSSLAVDETVIVAALLMDGTAVVFQLIDNAIAVNVSHS